MRITLLTLAMASSGAQKPEYSTSSSASCVSFHRGGRDLLLGETSGVTIRICLRDIFEGFARPIELPEVLERKALLVIRLRDGVAVRVGPDRQVVRLDGLVVLAVLQVRIADGHLRVVGHIGSRKRADVRREPLDGQIPQSGPVVG